MQKSQITFAPVSVYALRAQQKKPPPIRSPNDEPPPILSKGSETEFDDFEEPPPPPILEAEASTSSRTLNQTNEGSNTIIPFAANELPVNGNNFPNYSDKEINSNADEVEMSFAEPMSIHSRNLPLWMRRCPKCLSDQSSNGTFHQRIGGNPETGPIISILCVSCSSIIYHSQHPCESWSNTTGQVAKNAAVLLLDATKASDKQQTNQKDAAVGEKYSHQFGLNFPVMFKVKDDDTIGNLAPAADRITFRGFVYCPISRQVQTRAFGAMASHWRCLQAADSTQPNCPGLVRLERTTLTMIKGHKHSPDYAIARTMLDRIQGDYTRLRSVTNRRDRRKQCAAKALSDKGTFPT